MKKNTKITLAILIGSALFSIAFYAGFRIYFTNNPVVVCGDDKYSKACLITYAVDLKLDKKPFIDCVNGNSTDNIIADDANAASVLNLTAGPALYIGQLTDNSSFTGFYVSVSTYDDLKTITENALNKGIAFAQSENLAAVKARTNASVKSYLEGQGFSGSKYNSELAKIQPQIDSYLGSFSLFNIQMKINNILGSNSNKISYLYFADYASQYVSQFNSILLSPLKTNYIDNGKVALIIKELPASNDLANSKSLASAALCAASQNKYFEYSDFLQNL